MMEAHWCMLCEHECRVGLVYDVKCFVMFKYPFSQDSRLLCKISYAVWSNCCLHKSQWSSQSDCIPTNENNTEVI